jgi:sulfur carrier protein ThiS
MFFTGERWVPSLPFCSEEYIVKLEVRLFAGLMCNNKDLPCFGKQEFYVDAPDNLTVKEFHEFLKLGDRPLITVVNGVVEKKDFTISDNDRVGIFPPIAGG